MIPMQEFHDSLFSSSKSQDTTLLSLLQLTRSKITRILASVEDALYWAQWHAG